MKFLRSGLGTAVLAVIVMVLSVQVARKSAECRRQAARIDGLTSQARDWQQDALDGQRQHRNEADSLRHRLSGLAPHTIGETDLEALRERGLQNPVADLIADLQRHPELIPEEGVLGGRMGFYSADRIRVLSERWMYAPFDDGHIAGEAILEFDVDRSGRISWKVIEWRMS